MHDLPATRATLLDRLQSDDDHAWSEFLKVYERAIRAYCRRRGLQEADAQDATQEVLAAVHRRLDDGWELDPNRGTFRGWLMRVTRNRVANRFLSAERRARATGDSAVLRRMAQVGCDERAQEDALWKEYRRALMQRAAEIVEPQVRASSWQAFRLTAVEGLAPDAVAEELGMTVGGVYTAKCRVLARIREVARRLDPCGEEDER